MRPCSDGETNGGANCSENLGDHVGAHFSENSKIPEIPGGEDIRKDIYGTTMLTDIG